MRLMLDTHALLWWLRDNPRLGPQTRALIADPRNETMISIASFWEISIKLRLQKIDESGASVLREIISENFAIVEIEADHLEQVEQLPKVPKHNDPFDHLILAQAQVEGAIIITSDIDMSRYGIPCIDCR
jgi:PIN domain nuclease of toxin-antitoxin system